MSVRQEVGQSPESVHGREVGCGVVQQLKIRGECGSVIEKVSPKDQKFQNDRNFFNCL